MYKKIFFFENLHCTRAIKLFIFTFSLKTTRYNLVMKCSELILMGAFVFSKMN